MEEKLAIYKNLVVMLEVDIKKLIFMEIKSEFLLHIFVAAALRVWCN